MGVRDWFRRGGSLTEAGGEVAVLEARALTQPDPGGDNMPERLGYVYGVPDGGLNEIQAGMGTATGTDRKSMLQELYEAYITCPWSWSCVNAIARTITAGGLVTDWDADTGEGDEAPDKPPEVLALERFIAYCNPTQDIRQVLRNVVADLQVFGGAYLEVAWWGNTPVAIWNQDYPTTTPIADEHGKITGYVQVSDYGQRATFEPKQIIYISLDSARAGVFGVSPTQAVMAPITAWLFAHATSKEMFRKGLPNDIHADLPAGMSENETKRWGQQYVAGNLGSKNIGRPVITKGGGKIVVLAPGKVADCLAFMDQKRDEVVAGYGVPPAKAGIIESGNLGGGTGEAQDRTYRVDTCGPIAQLILEKLDFHIVRQGFGVTDWHLKFPEIDYRDSQIIENIRDQRLRNGSWTLNKYRAEIGEPPVDGGDDPVLVDRQNLVLWRDMARMSDASIAAKGAPAVAAGEAVPAEGTGEGEGGEEGAGQTGNTPAAAGNTPPAAGPGGKTSPPAPAASGKAVAQQGGNPAAKPGKPGRARESWQRRYADYEQRLSEALRAFPDGWHTGDDRDGEAA